MTREQLLLNISSVLSTISLLFVVLMNVAGTSIQHSRNPHKYNSTALSFFHILEVQSFYWPDQYPPNITLPGWIYHIYLNGACATPNICLTTDCNPHKPPYPQNFSVAETNAFWPICLYRSPGRNINVIDTLKDMDPHLYGRDGVFPDSGLYYPFRSPGNWSKVIENTYVPDQDILARAPFALWVSGATFSYVFVVSAITSLLWTTRPHWLTTNLERYRRGKAFTVFLLNFLPFLCYFAAIIMLTSQINNFMTIINDTKTESSNDVYVGSPFLIVAWVTAGIQLVASISAYRYWKRNYKKWQREFDQRRRLENQLQDMT